MTGKVVNLADARARQKIKVVSYEVEPSQPGDEVRGVADLDGVIYTFFRVMGESDVDGMRKGLRKRLTKKNRETIRTAATVLLHHLGPDDTFRFFTRAYDIIKEACDAMPDNETLVTIAKDSHKGRRT